MDDANRNPSVPISGAAALSGLSSHMITYLGRMDILTASGGTGRGRGRRRMYTFNDVIFLRVIADLLSKGIEVKRLGQALQRARLESDAWIDIRKAPGTYLITDGTEVFVRRKGNLESKTTDRQLAFAFVLDLNLVHRDIAGAWPERLISAKIA